MNERIKELSRIAKDWASDSMMEYNSDDTVEPIDFIFFYTKEFAELIVRECAEIADNADATREKWEGIGKYVREHFGVE